MILSDWTIRKIIEDAKHPLIEPFKLSQLQPASYDLTLGDTILYYPQMVEWNITGQPVELRHSVPMVRTKLDDYNRFVLFPGQFCLATTEEIINIPRGICANVDGKSSIARVGVLIHITAGFVDPGFQGRITLEVYNASKIARILRKGELIAQIKFQQLDHPNVRMYGDHDLGSHYQGQDTTTPIRS